MQLQNMNRIIREQYEAAMKQHKEQVDLIEVNYETLMKAHAENFEQLRIAHEAMMDKLAQYKKDQIELLNKQYAMDDIAE